MKVKTAYGEEGGQDNSGGGDADVDHTTSFAKPKSLDPKTIRPMFIQLEMTPIDNDPQNTYVHHGT
jgi:hypothetical protein